MQDLKARSAKTVWADVGGMGSHLSAGLTHAPEDGNRWTGAA